MSGRVIKDLFTCVGIATANLRHHMNLYTMLPSHFILCLIYLHFILCLIYYKLVHGVQEEDLLDRPEGPRAEEPTE